MNSRKRLSRRSRSGRNNNTATKAAAIAFLLSGGMQLSCCTLATASTIVTSSNPADDTDGDNDASNINIIREAMTTTMKNIMAEASDAATANTVTSTTSTRTTSSTSTAAEAATGSMNQMVQDIDLDADLYDENMMRKDEQEMQYDHTNQSHQYTATTEHGHWGTPHSKSGSITHPSSTAGTTTTTTTSNNAPHSHMHIHTHKPPDAFKLAARIKHKGTKSKSYFQFETIQDPLPSIPFLECNSVGTTTPPIPANNISFRSFPKSAHPSSYTHTRGFIVPLTKIEIEVQAPGPGDDSNSDSDSDSNSRHIFHAGEIIWVDGMYRMSSAEEGDLSVLIVNVPKEGKSRDLFGIPLKVNIDVMNCNEDGMGMWGRKEEDSNLSSMVKDLANDVKTSVSLRRAVLGTVGVGLSSLMTYFWIKVAPLQLAVGIGGVCMVSGGTLALVLGGEFICDQLHEYVVNVREDRDNLEASDDEEEEERGGLDGDSYGDGDGDGYGDEEEDNYKDGLIGHQFEGLLPVQDNGGEVINTHNGYMQ